MSSQLFAPLRIGPLELAGRVFKSATSETRASDRGEVTEDLLAFYEPLAAAGTPLIVTGNLYVSRQGQSTWRQAGIDSDDKLPGLREWAALAHAEGVRIFAQLNHCGRQVIPAAVGLSEAVSASDVREVLMGTKPRPLRRDEIAGVVESFAAAAARAREAGFDGVQIHIAHGYLLNQFLTPYTNRRADDYGGSPRNRMRLPLEVLRAVRERVGDDYPVIAKLNGHDHLVGRAGLRTADLVEVGRALEAEGLDAIEISSSHYESGPFMIRGRFNDFFGALTTDGAGRKLGIARRVAVRVASPVLARVANRLFAPREGFNLPAARQFTAVLTIPVICVGGFRTRAPMEQAIDERSCDAVSVARAMIADPLLYRHLREGGEARPRCEFCNGCIARAGAMPVDCYSAPIRAQRDAMLAEVVA